MIKQLNEESRQINLIRESVVDLCSSVVNGSVINESYSNLQSTLRKILVTNKVIPLHLALVIAKVIVFSGLLDEMIEHKKRYKKYTPLKKVYDYITDKVAADLKPATAEEVDNVTVDFIAIARDVMSQLTGKTETVTDVQDALDAMLNRLSTKSTERNRVQIMKLASLITQSNTDGKKRKNFIDTHMKGPT